MKKHVLTVLISSAFLLTACGSGDGGDSTYVVDDGIPKNNIVNPVVTPPIAYTATDMSAAASESVVMTYKMLGVDGTEVQATALVFVPATPAPKGGWKTIVWAHGTTGVADKCAPSQQGLNGTQFLLQQLLAQGYVVVAPDYEGLGEPSGMESHPFLNVKSEAFSITDAVVAARYYLTQQGKLVSKDWLAIGHSQGGQAVLGAAQYASRAQLNYKGTIAIAPASNLKAILLGGEELAINQPAVIQSYIYSPLDAFTFLIVDGMQGHKTMVDYSTVFKENLAALIPTIKGECFGDIEDDIQADMFDFSIANGNSLKNYGRTQTGFMNLPQIDTFLNKTSQPLSEKVSTPLIIYQGGSDQTVPQAATDLLKATAEAKGTIIQYNVDPSLDHTTVYTNNFANFVKDINTLMPAK